MVLNISASHILLDKVSIAHYHCNPLRCLCIFFLFKINILIPVAHCILDIYMIMFLNKDVIEISILYNIDR